MKRPRSFAHKFRGRKYKVRFIQSLPSDRDGDCDPPTTTRPEIRVLANLDHNTMLTALIHEALHACFWDIDDEAITEAAEDIAGVLVKAGIIVPSSDR